MLYGKYRTVGTFDVRRESALNIYIIYMYVIKELLFDFQVFQRWFAQGVVSAIF